MHLLDSCAFSQLLTQNLAFKHVGEDITEEMTSFS